MIFRTVALTTASALALSIAPAMAASGSGNADAASSDNGSKATQETQAKATDTNPTKVTKSVNGEWLTLNGKVESVDGADFKLDTGKDAITVEMDDFGNLNENPVIEGDHVTVSGLIDNDFLQKKTMEASSVYVDKLGTYFYADPADEEDAQYAYIGAQAANGGDWLAVTGTVQKISKDQIELDVGSKSLKVDTSDLAFDVSSKDSPWDLKTGDRVSVTGQVDDADLFDKRELNANSLVVLSG